MKKKMFHLVSFKWLILPTTFVLGLCYITYKFDLKVDRFNIVHISHYRSRSWINDVFYVSHLI